MAMITCSECGLPVSDKAAACPHCGNPINPVDHEEQSRQRRARNRIIKLILAVIIFFGVAGLAVGTVYVKLAMIPLIIICLFVFIALND